MPELQTANDSAVIVLRNHELDVLIAVDPFERPEIRRRQRVFEPFARAAERIVRQHPHNDIDVFTVARRMVIEMFAAMAIPVNLNAPAAGRETFRSRRSSGARRHSRRGGSRPHAPASYRPAARRRRARWRRRPEPRQGELMLHPRQRRVATLDLVRIEIGRRLAEIRHLEAAHRDIGLVAVLFQNSHSSIFAAAKASAGMRSLPRAR